MLAWLFALALADVPPDPGYVETCTIPIQCGPDIEGQTCRGVRPDDPPEPECDALAAQGWVRMCSAWGGTVYDVVMCREQPDPAALAERVAAAERAASCGACDATSAGAPPLALLLALALARRARRG
jgi:hypothetical protein